VRASGKSKDFGAIRIIGVITDKVGTPRNDGTPGGDLYEVPFGLSQKPTKTWINLFVDAWNRPEAATLHHRPGIARVEGNRIVLDGTTIEEVENYHLKVLKEAVHRANENTALLMKRRVLSERTRSEQHRRHVQEVAKRLQFE